MRCYLRVCTADDTLREAPALQRLLASWYIVLEKVARVEPAAQRQSPIAQRASLVALRDVLSAMLPRVLQLTSDVLCAMAGQPAGRAGQQIEPRHLSPVLCPKRKPIDDYPRRRASHLPAKSRWKRRGFTGECDFNNGGPCIAKVSEACECWRRRDLPRYP